MEIETNLLDKKIECQDQQIKELPRDIQSFFYFQIIEEGNIYMYYIAESQKIIKKIRINKRKSVQNKLQ